jgi:hypothetical protein
LSRCCCFVVDVCCGCWFHYFLVVFVTSFVVVVEFVVVSVLLIFVGFCGSHCSFDVVVTLLLMSVLVGSDIIDTPLVSRRSGGWGFAALCVSLR